MHHQVLHIQLMGQSGYTERNNRNSTLSRSCSSGRQPQHITTNIRSSKFPSCVVISAESINGIAREVVSALLDDEDDTRSVQLKEQLYNVAQRGALTVHPLVPGMCKGQSKPIMQHRVHKVCEEISKMLKKTFIVARRKASSVVVVVAAAAAADVDNKEDGNITQQNNNERYVLQIMLQSSNIAVARTW